MSGDITNCIRDEKPGFIAELDGICACLLSLSKEDNKVECKYVGKESYSISVGADYLYVRACEYFDSVYVK